MKIKTPKPQRNSWEDLEKATCADEVAPRVTVTFLHFSSGSILILPHKKSSLTLTVTQSLLL